MNAQVSTNDTDPSGTDASAIGKSTTASGARSTAMGAGSTASGNYSTAMGQSTTASGNTSTAMGDGSTASGNYSTAMTYETTASGPYSTAMGNRATASGLGSTAMGYRTTASEDYSLATGFYTTASGTRSTAMGNYTTASDFGSTVIGQYNSSGSSATSAGSFSTSAPAFVIGNGTSGSLSDAFKVMFNGDAYISSSLYLGGTAVTSTAAEINYVDGVTSNVQTQLDSKQATITGAATTITSSNLTASRALTSNGSGKVEVSAVTSTELGYLDGVTSAVQTQLDAKQATITGAATTIASSDLTASRVLVSNGTGKVEVSAVTSTELGYLNLVSSNVQTQLDSKLSSSGNITTGGNIIIPDSGNIGSSSDTDAITIANTGNVTFGQDVTVSGDVVISSDARLKSNIVSLGSTLTKLLQIDGKYYEMKGKQKIGVLAQEIQEVFPELVSEDDNEMLAVNYQGLVPVLINALKEQQSEIETYRDEVSELREMVQELASRD